jgi:hypothetical protein
MAKNLFEKSEEAAGIGTPTPTPAARGFTAPPYTGPRPWRGEKAGPVVQKPEPVRRPKSYKPGKLYPLKDIPLIPRAKGGPVFPSRSRVMKTKGSSLSAYAPTKKKRGR